jgi:tetratricopeptide (TPR) repeat protein
MSLLLDALKKAELAKQGTRQESSATVITREKLPDISQPLEILTDDLSSPGQSAAAPEPARSELSLEGYAAAPQRPDPDSSESLLHNERAQAQQLFEVKAMDYNPRRPFYLTLGVLALAGVAYGSYIWWQLRPKSSFGSVATIAKAGDAANAPAAGSRPGPVPETQTSAPTAPAPARIATAPTTPAAGARPSLVPVVPDAAPAPAGSRPTFRRRAASRASAGEDTQPRTEGRTSLAPITISPPTLTLDPLLEQAYEAMSKDDLATASALYLRVLAREPNNRNALLGLAVVDLRHRSFDSAEGRYLKLLELDPRDTHAVAGLIALHRQLDPVQAESRLKTLIANHPDATPLYFALGNQYAQQSLWTEAQAAYFKAFSADPGNADYAFNLAVSLDQLRQGKLAIEYYGRSLALADKFPVSFNRAQARARIEELGARSGQ